MMQKPPIELQKLKCLRHDTPVLTTIHITGSKSCLPIIDYVNKNDFDLVAKSSSKAFNMMKLIRVSWINFKKHRLFTVAGQ